MKKTVIFYQSGTGFTRQYAQWLARDLGCQAVDLEDRKALQTLAATGFEGFDTALFGGWFHAGGIRGLKWLEKQLPRLKGKRLAVFAVGASPAEDPGVARALAENLPGPKWDGVARFYLRGGLCYEKMGLADRFLMCLFRRMVRKKEGADSETYRGVCHSFSALDRSALAPIIAWAKGE